MQKTGARNHKKGGNGELCVISFLKTQGYQVLSTRFKTPNGEVDVVAFKGSVLYFCEVKTSKNFRSSEEILTPKQLLRIQNAALEFVGQNAVEYRSCDMQFDLFLVEHCGSVGTEEFKLFKRIKNITV